MRFPELVRLLTESLCYFDRHLSIFPTQQFKGLNLEFSPPPRLFGGHLFAGLSYSSLSLSGFCRWHPQYLVTLKCSWYRELALFDASDFGHTEP